MAEKNVPIYITDAVKIDGKHYAVGDVLPDMEPELALELAGAGRARLATEDEVNGRKKKPAPVAPGAAA